MTATPAMCENPCETCAKQGLPLLLARYAAMPDECDAPRLAGSIDSPDLKKVPLGNSARYGLRLLRSGYVYVFDEKRDHWDEYFATADGFLTAMPPRVRALKEQRKPATEFRCARNGAAPLAGVITIRNAKHAGKIWIGFSDVEWSDRVFQAHLDSGHRSKHMKCVTVSGGKVAPQPDTAPLDQVEKLVPEFKFTKSQVAKQFDSWSPHAFNSREGAAPALLKAAELARPGGGAAIVALHDPVGLAIEIAALMEWRKSLFMSHESLQKPLFAATTLVSLEGQIRGQAQLEEVLAAEQLAEKAELGPGAMNPNIALQGMPGDPAAAQKWRDSVTPAGLQKVAADTGRKYTHTRTGTPRFDEAGTKAWLKSFNEGLAKFDAEHIAPLARAHVSWMLHRCMVSHMACNYDDEDAGSGVSYTAVIERVIQGTQDKAPCFDQYVRWLGSDNVLDESNLVLRALGFNQKALLEKFQKLEANPFGDWNNWRGLPTDAVVNAAGEAIQKMPSAAQKVIGALIGGLSGPKLAYWRAFQAGQAGPHAMALAAAVTDSQIIRVPVVGKEGAYIEEMIKQMQRLDPRTSALPQGTLKKSLKAQIRLLQIQGVPIEGTRKMGWYVLVERGKLQQAFGQELSGNVVARLAAKSVLSPAQVAEIDQGLYKAAAARAGLGAGILGAVLLAWNYTKLAEDMQKAMLHESRDAMWRLRSGTLAIGGWSAELVGKLLQKVGEIRLPASPGLQAAGRALAIVGRGASAAAGLVVSVMDSIKAAEEYNRRDYALAFAYGLSAVAGAALAAAVLLNLSLAVIVPLLAVVVLITVLIELNKDNKLQEWILRCHFGQGQPKFSDAKTQETELKLALD